MIITRCLAPAAPSELRSATFTGDAWASPEMPSTDGTTIATVFFTPGGHTYWHSHERGQVLIVLAGVGLICSWGEAPREIRAGDIVWVPPGERHWHGASVKTAMSHTAISLGKTSWEHEVDDAEYTAPVENETCSHER